jgi:hypothetical protein
VARWLDPRMIEPGDAAPDFTLPDQDGNAVELRSLRGRAVVVYFYPKADTPKKVFQNGGVGVGVLNLWGVSPRIGGGGGALKVRDH